MGWGGGGETVTLQMFSERISKLWCPRLSQGDNIKIEFKITKR